MAAREQEAEPVVGDGVVKGVCRVVPQPLFLIERGDPRDLLPLLLEARAAPQAVEGLVAGG